VLTLLFIRHLSAFPQLRVVDSGVVRQQLLAARIIMDGGPSLRDAETIAALIDADFVLGGRVTRYQDYQGAGGRTRVEFSTVMIERKTRRVVWSSDSYNDGRDGVRFFERGTSRTAHSMATQMVGLTTERIARREH
jgi:TolB-like protein